MDLGITLGERVTLLAGGASVQVGPDEVLPVRVQWEPADKWHSTERLHLLLRLIRLPETGPSASSAVDATSPVAQADRALVLDGNQHLRMGLLIPRDAPAGPTRLVASIYREADGQSLIAPTGEETVLLGEVIIEGR